MFFATSAAVLVLARSAANSSAERSPLPLSLRLLRSTCVELPLTPSSCCSAGAALTNGVPAHRNYWTIYGNYTENAGQYTGTTGQLSVHRKCWSIYRDLVRNSQELLINILASLPNRQEHPGTSCHNAGTSTHLQASWSPQSSAALPPWRARPFQPYDARRDPSSHSP